MGDTARPDGAESPDGSDETARLQLPSLSLPGFGRRRRRRTEVDAAAETDSSAASVVVGEPELQPEPAPGPRRPTRRDTAPEPPTPSAQQAEPETDQRRAPRSRPSLPTPPGWVAALVTGLVVGAAGVALTYLSLRGCEAVRGTQTCGGPGLLLLVVFLVLMVLLGGVVLAVLGLPDSRSTSFLAIGVLCVVVLLAPTDRLFSAWMFLLVPLVAAAAYVLAHRVTTTFVEPGPEKGPEVDVR